MFICFSTTYNQNDYFSGKIKQKPFSEVTQYIIWFATTYFKTT